MMTLTTSDVNHHFVTYTKDLTKRLAWYIPDSKLRIAHPRHSGIGRYLL